ncbi:sodium-and chloride-dependent gaba transporter ine [Plakobranchus ocellatus]|uniref:Sodium-and chloride-dependent gaba transporter ine n=1 Tax=Plakobranchus ocellatus TaxID=259542 RepID=A0AAV4AIY7_9GAST|nr:sodium-and chloride-dependent gaba transporter ine [Plakobranchus ocellatus]
MAPPSQPDTTYFFGFDLDEMATSLSSSSSSGLRPYGRAAVTGTGHQPQDEDRPSFQSRAGLVLSCLGCVVGTGNIWRFPRIVANNAKDGGMTFRFFK